MGLRRRSVLAGIAGAFLSAQAQAATELVLAVPDLPTVIEPQLAFTPLERAVARELFLGLVTYDASGALVPGLAESWTVSDDGLTYTFALRQNAVWSDGTPIIAADAQFALVRAATPATRAPFAGLLAPIAGAAGLRAGTARDIEVKTSGRHTLRITLTARNARFLEVLAQPVAAPIPRAQVTKLGADWGLAGRLVTSGAFLAGASPDSFTLSRNSRAVLPGNSDLIRFERTASFTEAAARVRAGRAHAAWGFAPEMVAERELNAVLKPAPGQALMYVAVNGTRPKLGERIARHALGMVIERETLVRNLRLSNAAFDAAPGYGAVPPAARADSTLHLAPYQRIGADDRLTIAQVLVTEVDVDAAHPYNVGLAYPTGRIAAAIAKGVAASWAKIGFRAELQERSAAEHARVLHNGDYDLAIATSDSRDATPWPYLEFLSAAAGPDNFVRYAEPDFDRHLADAVALFEPELIAKSLGAAEEMLAQDQIILPLFVFTPLDAVGKVTGWEANARGLHPLRLLGPG